MNGVVICHVVSTSGGNENRSPTPRSSVPPSAISICTDPSKITATSEVVGGGLVEVKGKKFQDSPLIPGPSPYTVDVALPEDFLEGANLGDERIVVRLARVDDVGEPEARGPAVGLAGIERGFVVADLASGAARRLPGSDGRTAP